METQQKQWKFSKQNNKYDRLWYKLDKTLFGRLIKTWVDNRNDDNSRYYIAINFPPAYYYGIYLNIAQNIAIYHVLSIRFV